MNANKIYDELKKCYRSDNEHNYVVGNITLKRDDVKYKWTITLEFRETETFLERHEKYASYEPFELGGVKQPTQIETVVIKRTHSSQFLVDINVRSHVLDRKKNFQMSDIVNIISEEVGTYTLINSKKRKTITNPFVFMNNDVLEFLYKLLKDNNE